MRFGRGVHIETALDIGDDVLISSYVGFVGNDHPFDDPTKTVFSQGRATQASIRLDGDNLIGFGTVIVGNVTIGRGAIIGAGRCNKECTTEYRDLWRTSQGSKTQAQRIETGSIEPMRFQTPTDTGP